MSVLSIDPDPPVRAVPPMTTAAMTRRMLSAPTTGEPVLRLSPSTVPARPPHRPLNTKAPKTYVEVGMPDSRDASGLPPTA